MYEIRTGDEFGEIFESHLSSLFTNSAFYNKEVNLSFGVQCYATLNHVTSHAVHIRNALYHILFISYLITHRLVGNLYSLV